MHMHRLMGLYLNIVDICIYTLSVWDVSLYIAELFALCHSYERK